MKQNLVPQRFFAIDVGDLYMKFALCEKEGEKWRVLSCAKEEVNVVFWKQPLEKIWKIIKDSSAERMLVSFSSSIFKAKIATYYLLRKNPHNGITKEEVERIESNIRIKMIEALRREFFAKQGIQEKDFFLCSPKVLLMKIDGCEVPYLEGRKGLNLEFLLLCTYVPRTYWDAFDLTASFHKMQKPLLIHEVSAIQNFARVFKKDGIFLDIGNTVIQLTGVKNGQLLFTKEIHWGGEILTQQLEQKLGMKESAARELKEKYARGEVAEDMRKKIKSFFLPEVKKLDMLIEEALHEFSVHSLPRFLFGGSSLLPELKEIFESDDHATKILTSKDLGFLENFSELLNPSYTPLFLEYYAKE